MAKRAQPRLASALWRPCVSQACVPLRLARSALVEQSVTEAGATEHTGAAALSGTGSLSATGTRTVLGAAALSGTGTLSSTGTRTAFSAASLAGVGSVTSGGDYTRVGSASLAGTGLLTASGTLVTLGAADLSGTGVLSVLMPVEEPPTAGGRESVWRELKFPRHVPAEIRAEAHLYGFGWLEASGEAEEYDPFPDLLVLELV